jgi:hypothetical protein
MNRNYEGLELNTVLDMLENETTCEDARELALALNPPRIWARRSFCFRKLRRRFLAGTLRRALFFRA